MRLVGHWAIAYLLLFFLGAEAAQDSSPQEQQQQDHLPQKEQKKQQHFNQTPSETTTDNPPALQAEPLRTTPRNDSRAPAVTSERDTSASGNLPVPGGAGAEIEPPVAQHGQWYPQQNNPPPSDGDSILRNMRLMHQMGIPIIRDPNLLQQFGIPRAVENPRPAGDGSTESNSADGNGRPPSSGASTPAASSPASFPTLASMADLRAIETGVHFEPALHIYHGKYL